MTFILLNIIRFIKNPLLEAPFSYPKLTLLRNIKFFILKGISIEIPLMQIIILVIIFTVLALCGRFKFIVPLFYAFVLYWVFFLNEVKFALSNETEFMHSGLFIIFSVIFITCSAWIFFTER